MRDLRGILFFAKDTFSFTKHFAADLTWLKIAHLEYLGNFFINLVLFHHTTWFGGNTEPTRTEI